MNDLIKQIFWRMPIPHELKERLAQYRYEKILDRESAIEGSGSSIELVKDNDLIREYAQFVLGQFGYRCEEYSTPRTTAMSPWLLTI